MALINKPPQEEGSATAPSWFKRPLHSFIYLRNWKTAAICILSLRPSHVSGQLQIPNIVYTHMHSRNQPQPTGSWQQHRNTTHKHNPFCCCSGLWGRREIIYRLLFLWESGLFPRPVWHESATKSFVLDWLIGWLESGCLWQALKFDLMRRNLTPHPPINAPRPSFAFFFFPSLSLLHVYGFIFFIGWEWSWHRKWTHTPAACINNCPFWVYVKDSERVHVWGGKKWAR